MSARGDKHDKSKVKMTPHVFVKTTCISKRKVCDIEMIAYQKCASKSQIFIGTKATLREC